MPKKPTGYAKSGKGQKSPIAKQAVPNKAPSIKSNSLPTGDKIPKGQVPMPMNGGANAVAKMPGVRVNTNAIPGQISRPPKLQPRTPRI